MAANAKSSQEPAYIEMSVDLCQNWKKKKKKKNGGGFNEFDNTWKKIDG